MNEIKKIGNMTIDYKFYKGEDLYSDGEVEDVILEAYMKGTEKELLKHSNLWPVLYHISDIRENIIDWVPFENDCEILEIGSGCGAITGALARKAKRVVCIDLSEKRTMINAYKNGKYDNIYAYIGNFMDIKIEEKFDYITMIGVWEYASQYVGGNEPYRRMLEIVKSYLKPNGRIIIAIENKTGLKYFNGAVEDHTNQLYSGLNDYIGTKVARTFSKSEIEDIFREVGIENTTFYYPMSDYKLPDRIYSHEYLPKAGELRMYRMNYNAARIYNFFEDTMYDQVCSDGMFDYFANSFLIIAGGRSNSKESREFVKYSRLRKEEFRIVTYINRIGDKKIVQKKSLNELANNHIKRLKENEILWKKSAPQFEVLQGEYKEGAYGDEYTVPFIEGETISQYLYKYRNEYDKFISEVKRFIDYIFGGDANGQVPFSLTEDFKQIFGNVELGKEFDCYKITNLDLTFDNLIIHNKKIYSVDCEWIFDFNIPIEYVKWRCLEQIYDKYQIYLKQNAPREQFEIELGINVDNMVLWKKLEKGFARYVFGNNMEEDYLKQYEQPIISHTVRIQ